MNTQKHTTRFEVPRARRAMVAEATDYVPRAASVRLGHWLLLPAEPQFMEDWLCQDRVALDDSEAPPVIAEQVYRTGDEDLYVSPDHPFGVSRETYRRILRQNPTSSTGQWQLMRRNGVSYIRGRVSQDGVGQLDLSEWHLAVRIGASPAE